MVAIRFFSVVLILFLLVSCKEKTKQESPVSETQITPTVSLEWDIAAQLGEGAFWNYKTQELYWIDILGKKLYRYHPATQTHSAFDMPSRIGTVAPQTDSTAVVALEDGIYIQNMKSGRLTQLSNVEADKPENRFNDGKCDPNGNLWVGSMHLAEKEPLAKLYKVEPNGIATAMLDSITISNGIVWTKDAKTMYYIDTPTATIRAFDFDTESSTISNGRVAVEVPTSLGYPDGMAIDEEDKLWVGMWNGNAVIRFDPLTGEVLTKIDVPAHNVTSCAFGGQNLDILYITTATVDMNEEEKKQFPLAGSVFKVIPGVKGIPSPFFGTLQE
ncbi:MAG: SMP-30/gluconolactonase/LRE family protein [Flavobacteriaceae bacterium]